MRAIQQVGRVGYDRVSELAREVRGTYLDATAWVVYDDVVPTLTRLSGLGWRHVVLSNHVPELLIARRQTDQGGAWQWEPRGHLIPRS